MDIRPVCHAGGKGKAGVRCCADHACPYAMCTLHIKGTFASQHSAFTVCKNVQKKLQKQKEEKRAELNFDYNDRKKRGVTC